MWIITTMHITRIASSPQQALQRGGRICSELRQTSKKKKLEKEVRLLFCSYWKNKVSKIKESPMQDSESDQ